jgi:hypothetical protein
MCWLNPLSTASAGFEWSLEALSHHAPRGGFGPAAARVVSVEANDRLATYEAVVTEAVVVLGIVASVA